MRPSPFKPETYNGDNRFVRDRTTGLVWHKVSYRTLYADTDRSKVVYHANYLRFFELGRATLMRDTAYPYQEVEESGYLYPIVDLAISFFYPLYYDDPIWVYTRPVNLERVRVTFDYIITHAEAENLICKGYTKHCALKKSGKVTAVDPMTVEMWESFPK
ncbi:acyl-CoA thioesterase [Thermodesulfobacteriota bacterium]